VENPEEKILTKSKIFDDNNNPNTNRRNLPSNTPNNELLKAFDQRIGILEVFFF